MEQRSLVKALRGILLVLVIAGCASKPEVGTPPPAAVTGGVSDDQLDTAIRETSDYLNAHLTKGNKLVILNIQSVSPALSEYVIDELIANTVNDRVFTVVDRQQLDLIRGELDFQTSGEVDDNSAQELGRMLGAQIIISGGISKIGNLYRLRIRALGVENAQIQGQFNHNIPEGFTITALLESDATGYGGSSGAASPRPVAPAPVAAPAPATPPAPTYKIGDTGPAGGIIFYDKGNNQDGWRYLEAASCDAGKAKWSAVGTTLSRMSTELGMGKWNTDYIDRYLRGIGESNCAAQLCLSYSQGDTTTGFYRAKTS
ncbi:MAG: CsgG/HfaB family protein [Treponema sp.]|jgi:hypothetical protein|nr:CsgG/HfaB family protein [Treponema sp.]